jgi:hypothetical protein
VDTLGAELMISAIIFVPIPIESNPLWKFEGEWSAEDKAAIETVLQKHSYKHKKPYRKYWLLICRRYGEDLDFHAAYGADVVLYGDTVEELVQEIDSYYLTGTVPANMAGSGMAGR